MADPAQQQARGSIEGFLPIHKFAMGVAVGAVAALIIFVLTAIHLVREPSGAPNLNLLSNYFVGYTVSWTGAFIGAVWAGFSGFVFGWFLAFVRNFVLATELVYVRARAELTQTRDFLDHI